MSLEFLDYSSLAGRSPAGLVAVPFDSRQHTQLINDTIFVIALRSLSNCCHVSVSLFTANLLTDSLKPICPNVP